jgi:hypothetical protein
VKAIAFELCRDCPNHEVCKVREIKKTDHYNYFPGKDCPLPDVPEKTYKTTQGINAKDEKDFGLECIAFVERLRKTSSNV